MESVAHRFMIVTFLMACVLIVGMLFNQWSVVLYAGMILIGSCLFVSLRTPLIPLLIAFIYIVLFSVMMGVHAAQPDLYILGWRPATFVALYLIWPICLILGVIYAMLFAKRQRKAEMTRSVQGIEG